MLSPTIWKQLACRKISTPSFQPVGYGCTTCIGNSGPLDPAIEATLKEGELVGVSVLSGNRNFEARVHGAIKSNFLMSPPLVVAYALAGTVDIDLAAELIGTGSDGQAVFLKDIWPSTTKSRLLVLSGLKPEMFQAKGKEIDTATPEWNAVTSSEGSLYGWDAASTYIQSPPFFSEFGMEPGTIRDLLDRVPSLSSATPSPRIIYHLLEPLKKTARRADS